MIDSPLNTLYHAVQKVFYLFTFSLNLFVIQCTCLKVCFVFLHYLEYFLIDQVYAPLLLDDGKYSRNIDPKLQSLLSELEAGLGSAIRKRDPSFKGRTGEEENLGSK